MESELKKVLLNELNEWDLSCCEESTLKNDLAKSLAEVVKKFNISAVGVPFYCHEQDGNGLRCETQCLGCDGCERNE